MKINYDEKLHSEAQKYRTRLQNETIIGNRSSCYAAMGKLGERPGEAASNTFTLPGHAELNYSAQESAELIADQFANISQEYHPIKVSNFPPKMRDDLLKPNMSVVPQLEEFKVFRKYANPRNQTLQCLVISLRGLSKSLVVNYPPQ